MNHDNNTDDENELRRKKIITKILQIIENAYQHIHKQQKIMNENFIQRISLNLEQNKIQYMLNHLTNKYFVIKHSEGTKLPHQKLLYISDDKRFLCWKTQDKNNQKSIQLQKIVYIAQNQDVKTYRKSSTLNTNSKNCFIILSDVRTLQIQCKNQDQADQIVTYLQEAIKNSKRMHLSYKF